MQNRVLHLCEVIQKGFAELRKGIGQNGGGKIEPASLSGRGVSYLKLIFFTPGRPAITDVSARPIRRRCCVSIKS